MEPLTPQSNLTAADTVGLWSCLFLSMITLGLILSSGQKASGGQSGTIEVPMSSEEMIRYGNRNDCIHAPLGSPLHGIEGVDEQE